ncbi:kelch-like protein 28 [Amphiura filiformis]|uniref:kelch-like protein 28 n=1 Tax=Amphiura filiformis TaxID=82378 RepID=UPI003B21C99A
MFEYHISIIMEAGGAAENVQEIRKTVVPERNTVTTELTEEAVELKPKSIDCRNALIEGLSLLFNDEATSDVTLVVGETRYHAHKTILAASSEFFHRMFYGGQWKEADLDEVILQDGPPCEDVFDTFLQYFYTGTVNICPQNVHHLVSLADKYDVKVKENCLEYMSDTIDKGNVKSALEWMPICYQLEAIEVLERCYDVICFNLEKACEMTSWLKLSLLDILIILKRTDIIVPSEYTTYVAVQKWILAQKECATDTIEELLSYVEFQNMNPTELMQVEKSPLATFTAPECLKHQLYESFRYLALTEEGIRDSVLSNAPRCYTKDKKLRKVRFTNRACSITPTCHYGVYGKHVFLLSSVGDCYSWTLSYLQEEGDLHFRIVVPRVTRKLEPDEQRNPYMDTDEELLYNDIPGTVRVDVLLLLRNSQGVICHIGKISTDTEMPMANGGCVVQLPISSWRKGLKYLPNDCLYSFEIAKIKSA